MARNIDWGKVGRVHHSPGMKYGRGGIISENFDRFNEKSPHVYEKLVEMSIELKNRGNKHFGMQCLFEVLRWKSALKTAGSDFKLNNSYTPIYSRWIMDTVPELEGFFRVRKYGSEEAKHQIQDPKEE